MNKAKWYSVACHTATLFGGILISLGWVHETVVIEITGIVLTLLGVIFGIKDKA